MTEEGQDFAMDLLREKHAVVRKAIRDGAGALATMAYLLRASLEISTPSDGGKYVRGQAEEAERLAKVVSNFLVPE